MSFSTGPLDQCLTRELQMYLLLDALLSPTSEGFGLLFSEPDPEVVLEGHHTGCGVGKASL